MSNWKNKIWTFQQKTSDNDMEEHQPSSQSQSSTSTTLSTTTLTKKFSKKHSQSIIITKSLYIFLLACFGILFIIIGLLFYLAILHSLIHKIITEKLAIAEGSETFEKWKQIPMPVYYRYYFFNVSNPIEIERNGERPQVREIGPFTYRSRWIKDPIKFHSNGTVTFRERKSLEFVPELSIASDRDRILVTVNGPLTVTLALLQKAPLVVRNIVSLGLSTVAEGFFIRRSARELLFDGYHEVLTSFGPLLNPNIPNTKGRFGWLYGRNNTDDGSLTVFTGQKDFTKINQIDRYNGHSELQFWKPKSECNRLKGSTDGQIIAINDERTFKLFHPELCRTIKFIADETGINATHFMPKNYKGDLNDIKITVDRYIPDSDTLGSMDEHPLNSCYSSKITPSRPELGDILVSIRERNQSRFVIKPFFRTKNGRIIFRSGVFDLSECKYGAPVLLSYPHFLYAHPNYRENIGGLRPDRRKHQFHMMVEPNTGTSIRSYARIQINIYITKPPWISRFRYIPEVVFPVFWQELRAEASSEIIEHLNWALTKPFIYADIFSIVIIVIGLILVSISGYWLLFQKHKNKTNITETNIDKDENNFVMFQPTELLSKQQQQQTKNNNNLMMIVDNNKNRSSPPTLSITSSSKVNAGFDHETDTTTTLSSSSSSTTTEIDNSNQDDNPVKS
uniref:Scavenger receptor class B member 1 n=1 Tax=Dermatophagoides pteronyssinus TaxID=6956 RepID=A0A6P6YD60_DERPT|nr:scavenger receptor class B member 1-like isoform X1 [Dermatophagoides pteronyssinus]